MTVFKHDRETGETIAKMEYPNKDGFVEFACLSKQKARQRLKSKTIEKILRNLTDADDAS